MGRAGNSLEELRPEFGAQLLGIVETVESPVLEKNNCGSNYGTGERTATGFVDAGDKKNAPLLKSALLPE